MPTSGPSMKIQPCVLYGVPEAVQGLIWQTFFANADRGVDFATHLPWHADPTVRTVVLLNNGGKAMAAAVLRPARQSGVIMVGYVCVDDALRGQGHGRSLIAAVNAAVDDLGYRAALLWTGKPEVYVGQGYVATGNDDFLQVTRLEPLQGPPILFAATAWPGEGDTAGLPAFATTGRRLRSEHAEAIVVEGGRGVTLVDWKGSPADVLALIDAACPVDWSVNISAGDKFALSLTADRYNVKRQIGATVMVRCADPTFSPAPVPIADRI